MMHKQIWIVVEEVCGRWYQSSTLGLFSSLFSSPRAVEDSTMLITFNLQHLLSTCLVKDLSLAVEKFITYVLVQPGKFQ
jgi:hypothetical protein